MPGQPSTSDDIQNLQRAIAALAAQRGILGDAVVEAALKPLHEQLAALTTPPDERKRVTILFADVSGFTAMSEHLDPEDVTAIMNRCFESLSMEVIRYGGVIDKYSGDAVMALFGAPKALENHEEMSIRASLAMQDALMAFSAELEQERGCSVRMRIGLNTGEVLAGLVGGVGDKGYTVMGDAVNLASRLEHACPVGRVMVSTATANTLHPVFDFEPPQQITVRGKTEAVTVYLVIGPKADRGRMRGLAGLSAPMIGRDQELGILQAALRDAQSQGRWRAVAVVGEAGIGKTRLRREFLAWTARHYPQARILGARCYAHTQATPYHLLSELMHSLFGVGYDDDAATVLGKLEDGLAALSHGTSEAELGYRLGALAGLLGLPLAEDPLRGLEPQQRRDRIFLSLERVLMAAVRQSSLVIMSEDMHWVDDLSLAFLMRFIETARQDTASGQPALLLMISRPPGDSQESLKELLAQTERPPYRTLTLQLLDFSQSNHLITELLRRSAIPDEIGDLIVERAQGNPFFVEEIIRSFIEDGTVAYDEEAGVWRAERTVADIRVPDNVQGVLAARIDRLATQDRKVAQYAAIIGRTFWQRLLIEITDQSVDASLSRLEAYQLVMRLAESQIADDWEWLFRHVLVQDVAYANVTKAMRRRVHGRVAQWLETHAGDRAEMFVPLIAYHYERAGVKEKGLHYLTLAADQAARAFANRKAVEFCTRALALVTDNGARFGLLRRRQEAYGQLGERDAQWADLQERLRLAEQLDDDRRRAQTLNTMGWVMVLMRRDLSDALSYLQQALGLFRQVGDRGGEGICLNNIGIVHGRRGKTEEALACYEQALQLARQVGDRRREGHGLNNIGMVYWRQGGYSRALAFYRQALLIRQETEDRYHESIGHANVGEVHRRLGHYERALAGFKSALSISRAIGDQEGELYVLYYLGLTHADLRQFDAALEQLQDLLRLARERGSRGDEAGAQYGLGLTVLEQGNAADALVPLQEARAIHEELGWDEELGIDLCVQSRVHLALGNTAAAAESITQAVALLGNQPGDLESAPTIYYQYYWAAPGRARQHLEEAYRLLISQASRISDGAERQSFLEKVPVHQAIIREVAELGLSLE